jgi:hypothetical protein
MGMRSNERLGDETMMKLPVRVMLGREVQRTVPGMLGRKFDFKAGYTFLTKEWFYPGEPEEKSAIVGKIHDSWRFGTNTGTDLPLVFAAEDVSEVVIPNDPETVQIFEKAPFKVTLQD